jgi:protein-L-isoaspartate(D-aspartate) O-methyltransferase
MHKQQPSQASTTSLRLRQALVNQLKEQGAIRSYAVEQAFLMVAREHFVPFFYQEDTQSKKMDWIRFDAAQSSEEAYLEHIYRDQPLVIRIDARGWPVSSSSLPSVMAKMLEALDVHPGQRVLEIGTGSGYNAALLASLAGDPRNVFTIERDALLAQRASAVLDETVGNGVTVITGDGFLGSTHTGPYQRIMATASVPTIPPAWIAQLAPGGKLVMDLHGPLASGFLVVEKAEDGKTTGYFLDEPLYFMPLETDALVMPEAKSSELVKHPSLATFRLPGDAIFPHKLFDSSFGWFLQWSLPGCQVRTQKRRLATGLTQHTILFFSTKALLSFRRQETEDTWQVHVYGQPLWDDLQQSWHDFLSLGMPRPQEYRLVVEDGHHSIRIGSFSFSLIVGS